MAALIDSAADVARYAGAPALEAYPIGYLFSAFSQVQQVPVAPGEPPIRERGAGRLGW